MKTLRNPPPSACSRGNGSGRKATIASDTFDLPNRAALPQFALEPPTGTPQFRTLTYRVNARAILTGVEHQLSVPITTGWSTVAPDVTENLTPDPVTGDPRVRVKFSIAPGETKEFLRLLLTQ
ncbi:MAG: hypothetical protein ABIZ56_05810 [Chthoniobacteraceae bacterium]